MSTIKYKICYLCSYPHWSYDFCRRCYYMDENYFIRYKITAYNHTFDGMIDEDDGDEKCIVCNKNCPYEIGSNFCSKKCIKKHNRQQFNVDYGCQCIIWDIYKGKERKCFKQRLSGFLCCNINHHWIHDMQQDNNGMYGCSRYNCPCPSTFNGVEGEYCCKNCQNGQACETPVHQSED